MRSARNRDTTGAAACGHRGCTDDTRPRWWTVPNGITALRTVGTVLLCMVAAGDGGLGWLLAALASYWLGDMADGLVARVTRTETRTGAVLDILADRLSVCLIVTLYVVAHPAAALPAGMFLVQFVVLDAYLSLAFLDWPLLSPNYFGLVDARVFRWNWSPPAKVLNTAAVVLLWLLTQHVVATTALALLVLAVKVATAVRLARRGGAGARAECAVRLAQPAP
ncbi:CDP-alcohol phosphatidyltransferase family protein [Amycolatopsis arida]|nr:CDP-alcohol phosphatidyltransferase family protein [Amycolatopsis arida]